MGLATATNHNSSTATAPFSAQANLDNGTLTVSIGGELDMATATELQTAVRPFEGKYQRIKYELDKVTFLDCSGLRALLAPANGRRRDVPVTITRTSRSVRRLLELVEMEQIVAG